MKTIKTTIILLAVSIFFFACSSDDSDDTPRINALNLITNIAENPAENASVGTVQAASESTLSFSITSQTPLGALRINPSTGELTIANATLFDYETNPVITAQISIIDPNDSANVTATINLIDEDDIAYFLSTSKAIYIAAADGEWVNITATEYNTLANSLNEVTKVATSDADYNLNIEQIFTASGYFTFANNNGFTMPDNSYVFGFKYRTSSSGVTVYRTKQSSTSVSEGYANVGGTFPASISGDNYLILKGSNTPTTNIGYLAFYETGGSFAKFIDGRMYSFKNSSTVDNNFLTNSGTGVVYMYQGLSTTQKQW